MEGNPYPQLLSMIYHAIDSKAKENYYIGTVMTPLPDLRVRLSDNIQIDTTDDLQIAEPLIRDYQQQSEYQLQSGDKVLVLLSQDEQSFIVLQRVVKI